MNQHTGSHQGSATSDDEDEVYSGSGDDEVLESSLDRCEFEGTFHVEGEKFKSDDGCMTCMCVNGYPSCVGCGMFVCGNGESPVPAPGECCPTICPDLTTPVPVVTDTPCLGDNEFKCDSGQCISLNLLCDNYHDCTDESDEKDCITPVTSHGYFPGDATQEPEVDTVTTHGSEMPNAGSTNVMDEEQEEEDEEEEDGFPDF